MNVAADMEDKTEKHPVTPGEVIPGKGIIGRYVIANEQTSLGFGSL